MTHTIPLDERKLGLWVNCHDSIVHSLHHFRSLAEEGTDFHNAKWAILSLHHAAEVYCNLLMVRFDGGYPGKEGYLSLNKLVPRMEAHPNWLLLSRGEKEVIAGFLKPLSSVRNQLMHREAPDDLAVSRPATALLALLHLVRRRTGHMAGSADFVDQDPPIELDVLECVGWTNEYQELMQRLVLETFGPEVLEGCTKCGSLAVSFGIRCEVCFEDA